MVLFTRRIEMTKELFIETMNALTEQYEHDIKCVRAFQTILPDTFTGMYDNSRLYTQLVKTLRIQMDDDTDDSWIDYYVDELDFGRLWRPGKVVIAGNDIKLGTANDLWNLLTTKGEQNEGSSRDN
jgi:hypothetical protein